MNTKLKEMLDPATQKLFAMLPPPKESNSQSITSALRTKDTKINFIQSKLDQVFDSDEDDASDDQG